jgi:two-component system sensor histidine kinase QseC
MSSSLRTSLSRRLVAILVGTSLAYWAVVVVIMINDSVNEAYELFDSQLAQTALALLRVSDPDDTEPAQMPVHTESPGIGEIARHWPHLAERMATLKERLPVPVADEARPGSLHLMYGEYHQSLRYQIWNRAGELLLRSARAPQVVMTDRDGFSQATDASGEDWRMFSVWDQHNSVRVIVAEAVDRRAFLLRSIALDLVRPMVLGLPILLFLLWLSIRRGLSPLRSLAREISRRRVSSLAPVDPGSSPDEIRPMVLALNELLQSVERAVENERCFTANAAHELRTPLAAIQAHLAAARATSDPAERERSLDQLQRGLERSVRLVGQLLTLARLDPEQEVPEAESVDIGKLLESTCAELAPLALQRDQVMELTVAPDLPAISGNSGMLAMLFTNLIDNAIRYTQFEGHISVNAYRDGNSLCVDVTDDGPGIPAADRERVFERFCRLVGQSKPGTGLGLAICRRVAELHGANIEMADSRTGKGLTARVCFGLPGPAA